MRPERSRKEATLNLSLAIEKYEAQKVRDSPTPTAALEQGQNPSPGLTPKPQ